MRRAVLDTDTLSFALKGDVPEVAAMVRQYMRVFRRLTTSVITVAEILEGLVQGAHPQRVSKFLTTVEEYEVLPIELEEAMVAGRILGALAGSGQKIGDLDPFIAAVAITNGLPLVTNNQRHYQRIVDLGFPLELDDWRQG